MNDGLRILIYGALLIALACVLLAIDRWVRTEPAEPGELERHDHSSQCCNCGRVANNSRIARMSLFSVAE